MYSFRNDYSEGAHPRVLQALVDTNLTQTCGYGVDPICDEARALIRTLCAAPDAAVHFLVGGTQTNMTVITALLASYEAVIAAHTGHVNCHETGAIEATGHKVCTAYSPDGKVTPEMVESVLAIHADGEEHMVAPKLVYISDTTEIGTVYTKAELTALRQCCDAHDLLLFLDGARLGSALTSPENDLTLSDLAALTDVFTIGGTKNGALFGEAVIMTVPCDHFRWHIKQRGGMLAKGRLLGVQFKALLTDNLYFDIARHAYIYFIYGMYHCLNFVTEPEGEPAAVLLRALEGAAGVDVMRRLRYGDAPMNAYRRKNFLNGPGKVCKALDLTTAQNRLDLTGDTLFLCDSLADIGLAEPPHEPERLCTGPRIGVDYAEEAKDFPWRFWLEKEQ